MRLSAAPGAPAGARGRAQAAGRPVDGDQRAGHRAAPGARGAGRDRRVGGVLRRHGAAAGARRRAHGDRLAAARADARPRSRPRCTHRADTPANLEEWERVHTEIRSRCRGRPARQPGAAQNNPGFRENVLPQLTKTAGLIVIDEAHCISDWGRDFRPDYRRIRTLLASLAGTSPVLATTATANARVTSDVAEPPRPDAEGVLVLRGSLKRESLRLAVVRLPADAARLARRAIGQRHVAQFRGSSTR